MTLFKLQTYQEIVFPDTKKIVKVSEGLWSAGGELKVRKSVGGRQAPWSGKVVGLDRHEVLHQQVPLITFRGQSDGVLKTQLYWPDQSVGVDLLVRHLTFFVDPSVANFIFIPSRTAGRRSSSSASNF